MKTKRLNNRGYSLVEIIIVIGMIGILLGASFSMFGYIRSVNTKKTVTTISSTLKKTQVATMSKGERYVVYIYKLTDGYYMKISSDPAVSLDSSGERIGNTSLDIYGVNTTTGTVLLNGTNLIDGTNDYVAVAYSRSGVYNRDNTNVDSLLIKGARDYTITLAKDTGKNIVE